MILKHAGGMMLQKKTLIIISFVVFLIAVIAFYARFGLKVGIWKYDSFAQLNSAHPVRIRVDIPAGATDQRALYKGTGIGYSSFYAFTLNDNQYQQFIKDMYDEYDIGFNPGGSNPGHGYAEWYLMNVGDAANIDYELNRFPVHLPFDKVIDDNINDYVIIVYSPVDTGTSGWGIIANPDTGRIVVYSEGHIR